MAYPAEQFTMTVAEYLALDREAEARHEFLNGQAYAMAGGTAEHAAIIANLIGALFQRLRGGKCRPTSTDQRIHVPATGAFVYADLSVVCGAYEYHPDDKDTLINPRVVFEVLSPSTADYDRGTKFEHYRRLDSLAEYVLVQSGERRIEHRKRLEDGAWIIRDITDGALALPTLGIELPLDEIYDLAGVRPDR